MSATPTPRSPLACLVLFMFCLAMAAGIVAAAHYLGIDLPAQQNVQAPENALFSEENCDTCIRNCKVDPDRYFCEAICKDLVCSGTIV